MAIRDLCSFDFMANADIDEKFTSTGNIGQIGVSQGRGGSNSLRLPSPAFGIARYGQLPNHATYGAAFAMRYSVPVTTTGKIMSFMETVAYQIAPWIDPGGRVVVSRGNSLANTLGTSTSQVFFPGVYHHVQFLVTISSTVGAYEVRVDGATVLSGSAVNTMGATIPFINGYEIGAGASNVANVDIDDLYIWDGSGSVNTGFPGDVRVLSALPNGAGATTNFTPTSGANYTTVDDPTPNITDYVSGTTVGNKDTYAFADIVGSGTVRGAMLSVYATKADVGAARGIKAICRSGSTEVLSAEQILGVGYRYWLQAVYEQDPATSALWATLAALNAAEFGVQVST